MWRKQSLHFEDGWQQPLHDSGLDDFEALVTFRVGKFLSSHSRGQTYRHTLANGQVVFIKQDNFTKLKIILRTLLHGRRPTTNTDRERRCYLLAASRGFRCVQVVAYGQETLMGLPRRGFIVTIPVPGKPLDVFCRECRDEARRRQAVANAEAVLKRLQDEGLDWNKDCKPEHFFVNEDDLSISLIDLERLRDRGAPLDTKTRERQMRRFHSLLDPILGQA